MTIETIGNWGNSRHKHSTQSKVAIVQDMPVVTTIDDLNERLHLDIPHRAGDNCEWCSFSVAKGYRDVIGKLTGRATFTLGSGVMLEVEGEGQKCFKRMDTLAFFADVTISSDSGSAGTKTHETPESTHSEAPVKPAPAMLMLPAPQIAGLLPAPKLTDEQAELADMAWMGFEDLLNAYITVYTESSITAFMSVYGVDPEKLAALDTSDLRLVKTGTRVTFYSEAKALMARYKELKAVGERASEIHQELKAPNSWQKVRKAA